MILLPQLVALCSSLIAVVLDLRTRRIPNWLTASTATLGVAATVVVLPSGLGSAITGGALLLVCAGLLSFLGLLGFGDTKLLGAIGCCVGLPVALRVLPCVVLSGGVLALVYMLRGGQSREVMQNLRRLPALGGQRVDESPRDLHVFPYAAAIALGTGWAIAGAYVPALALF